LVIPVRDKTLPTILSSLDTTLRRTGGVPTYALTDEKTVSVDHVARITARNPEILEVGRHYGMTIRTCVPADPRSKGGSVATVRIAKADLVPTGEPARRVPDVRDLETPAGSSAGGGLAVVARLLPADGGAAPWCSIWNRTPSCASR
jgi:transposase